MTLEELRVVLIPLALAFRAEFDGPTQRAYHRGLSDVAPALLQAAALRAMGGRFMPSVGELRQFAEDARKALLAAHPFDSCGACSQQGWTTHEIDGVPRQVRCRCWTAHQARIQALGVGSEPLALPAGVEP